MGLVVFVAVMVSVAGWTVWKRLQSKAREDQIPVMAAAKGLHFAAEDPFGSQSLPFPLFRQGDETRLENVVWSESDARPDGTHARVFDFGWHQPAYKRSRSEPAWRWFSCALAEPGGSWPWLAIVHQGFLEKAIELAQGDPIRFESEEFNRTFHVSCDDRRFASALIDPRMMQFLLETKGLVSFSTLGRFVLLACPQRSPEEMAILLGLADAFVRKVPDAVWELYPKVVPAEAEAANPQSPPDRGDGAPQ